MFDYNNFDLAEEIEKLKKIQGKERGLHVKYLKQYLIAKEGENAPDKVRTELKRLNYELPLIDKFSYSDWAPASMTTIYMLALVKVFNWQKNDVEEMGKKMAVSSPLVKFFIKYFLSEETSFKKVHDNWRKQYSWGELRFISYDKKNKKLILRLIDFFKHQVTCDYLIGSLGTLVGLAVGGKPVRAQEIKCVFKGDDFHEFEFTW